jgi:hypothetical protein
MNFTMRPVTEEGVRKVKLGEGLVFSVDALPPDLRRRWDIACAHIERGDNVAGALKAMTREAVEHLWPQIMTRVAHLTPHSVCDIGLEEKAQ